MPLKKSGTNGAVATPQAETAAEAATPSPLASAQAPVAATAPKAAPKAGDKMMTKDKTMTKEGYWERKEERDIETGKRIRRSGVWQASVQSVAALQFNQGGTLDSFLDLVDKVAERGLGFVNKD